MRICDIEGCGRKHLAKGLCPSHYERARWGYDMSAPVKMRHKSPVRALAAYTDTGGECHVWTGAKNDTGYGLIRVAGKHRAAHRYAWEVANGASPADAYVDHMCHNPACVRLDHLRLASAAENAANRSGADRDSMTGLRNVYPEKSGTFKVSVSKGGESFYFGTFPTKEEAALVAAEARNEVFGAYAGRG